MNKISSKKFNQVHDSLGALKLIASALTSDSDILSSFCVLAFDEVPNRNFTTKEYINRKADAKNGLNLVQKHLIAKEVSKLLKDASAFYDSELPSLIKTQADFKRPENVKVFKTAKFGDVALIDNKYHLVNPLTKTVTAEYIVLAADANFAKLHELIAKYRDEKDVKLTELDGQMVLTGAPEVINELEHLIKDIGYYCEAVDESTGVDGEIPEYSLKIFTDMKQAEPEFDIEKAAAKHEQVGEGSKFSYWLQLEDNYGDEGYLDSKKVGDHVGFFYVTEKGTQAPALLVSQLGFSGDGLTAQRTYPMKSKEPGKTYLYEEYGYTDDDFAEVYNFLNDGLKSVSPEMNKKNLDGLTVDNVDATNPNLEKDNPMLNSEGATEEVVEKTSAEKPVENKAEEKINFEKDLMEAGESKGEKDKVNETQLAMGKEVEKEHTTNSEIAEKITRDHLEEIPDYYTHLKEMEDNAKKNDVTKSSYAPFMTVDATKKEEIKIYSGDHFIGTCKTIQAAFEKSANEFAYDGNEGARTTHKIYEDEKIIITAEDQADEYFVTLYVGGLDQYPVHGKSINKEKLMADADKVNFAETESEENPRLKEFGVTLEMLAKADEEATKVLKGGTDPEEKAEAPVEAATKPEVTKTAEDVEDNAWVVEKTSAPTIDDQLTLDIFYVVNKNTHVVAHDAGFEPFIFPTQEDAQKHADKLNSQKEASAKPEVKKEAEVFSQDVIQKCKELDEQYDDQENYVMFEIIDNNIKDYYKVPSELIYDQLSKPNMYIYLDGKLLTVKEYLEVSEGPVDNVEPESAKEENIKKKAEDSTTYSIDKVTVPYSGAFKYNSVAQGLKETSLGGDKGDIYFNPSSVDFTNDSIILNNVTLVSYWEGVGVDATPEEVAAEIFSDALDSTSLNDALNVEPRYLIENNSVESSKKENINKKADEELKQFDMKQELDGQKEFEKQDDFSQVSVPEEKEDTSEVTETMEAKPEETKGESFSASEFGNNMAYIQKNKPEEFKSIMNNLKQLMVGDQQPIYDFLENWASHNFQDFTAMTREDPTYARHSQYQEQLKNNVLPKLKEMSEYKQAMEEKVSAEKGNVEASVREYDSSDPEDAAVYNHNGEDEGEED